MKVIEVCLETTKMYFRKVLCLKRSFKEISYHKISAIVTRELSCNVSTVKSTVENENYNIDNSDLKQQAQNYL